MNINKSLFVCYVSQKTLLWIRLLMIAAAGYFVWDIYRAFELGYVKKAGFEYSTYSTNFYAHIAIDLLKIAVFGWFGGVGTQVRKDKD